MFISKEGGSILVFTLFWVSYWDYVYYRIPNKSILVLILCVLVELFFYPISWMYSLCGFGLGFMMSYVAYRLHGIGGGDVKLVSILGFVLGPNQILWLIWLSMILGLLFFLIRSKLFNKKGSIIPFAGCISISYIILNFLSSKGVFMN